MTVTATVERGVYMMTIGNFLDVCETTGLKLLFYSIEDNELLWEGRGFEVPYWISKLYLPSEEELQAADLDGLAIEYRNDVSDDRSKVPGLIIITKEQM